MKKERIISIILIGLIVLFTISNVKKTFQNDTFFDIPIGKYVLENGIDMIDHFTWHDNLNYTYSHWLFGIIEAVLYDWFGFYGVYTLLLIISSLLAITIFWVLNKMNNNKILSFIITILTIYIGQEGLAARAQVITFLLFILEFYCIEKLVTTNKSLYMVALIIIPIIIANVHASVWIISFIFYLPYLAEFIIWNILNKLKMLNGDGKINIEKRNIKKLIVTMLISTLTGLITPIGNVPYMFMYNNITGLSTEYITELQPMQLINEKGILLILSLYIGIIAFTRTKVKITDTLYMLGLALMTFAVIRSCFYLIFIGAFLLSRLITECLKEYNIDAFDNLEKALSCKNQNLLFFSLFFLAISVSGILERIPERFVDVAYYPTQAVEYILDNIDIQNMRIFNGFNYGSYLELNGIPAFMDSRSEMYCKEFNDTTILQDVINMEIGQISYREVLKKYSITHVLIPKSHSINIYIGEDEEYQILYQDDAFILYEKIK